MRNLLKTNFARLFHDKIFAASCLLTILCGVSTPIIHFIDSKRTSAPWVLDFSLFTYVLFVPVLLAVTVSLFVGSEYDNGTLRNKIIAGSKRTFIYLANLTVGIAAGTVLCFAFFLPHLGLGLLLGGTIEASPAKTAAFFALGIALTAAYTSLFTLIAMLCTSKAHTAVWCILLAFALLLIGVYITGALNEPEILPGYSYTENGVTVTEPDTPNPNYIGGTKRKVYEFLQDFGSGGQSLQTANFTVDSPALSAAYDCIIILVSTLGGILLFRRRDLK